MATHLLTIHTDRPCRKCGTGGAADGGLCLECAARMLEGRRDPIMGKFCGRDISREVISLGLGGQIERGGEEFPPRATVRFEARAIVSSVKFKFTKDGTVEESTILVIDPESFRVLDIARGPEQEELPLSPPDDERELAQAAGAERGGDAEP
jgi:hypothetical protein